jgi:hypothetical protein
MAVLVNSDTSTYPKLIKDHLDKRIRERKFSMRMMGLALAWMNKYRVVPDSNEAPKGWFKKFSDFTILGEGQYWKTVYTKDTPYRGIHAQARQGAVDWDEWFAEQMKKRKARKMASFVDQILSRLDEDPFEKIPNEDTFEDVDEHPGSLDLPDIGSNQADELMNLDADIWDDQGYSSGDDVADNWQGYLAAVSQQVQQRVPEVVKRELSDNNYHSLVKALRELGL